MDLNKLTKTIKFPLYLFFILAPVLLPLFIVAPLLTIISGVAIGVFLIGFVSDGKERKFLLKLFLCSFLARILVAVFLHMIAFGWYRSDGFFIPDGWCYSENGWIIAQRLNLGISLADCLIKFPSLSGVINVYDCANGIIYAVVGKSPLTLFFLNCIVGSVTVIFIWFITSLIFEKKVSRHAAILCAFWPSLFLWSTQNLKDPFTILLVVLCYWGFISFLKVFNLIGLLVVLLAAKLLLMFRPPIGCIVAASIALHSLILFFIQIRSSSIFKKHSLLITLVAVILIISQISTLSAFWTKFQSSFKLSDLFSDMSYFRTVRASANLAIMPDYQIRGFGSLLLYLPVGLTMLIFGPFPWQLFSASQIVAAPEMLIWYLLIPAAARGLFLGIKGYWKYLLAVYIFMICTALMLSIVEGNVGTMFRHRSVIVEFVLIFIAAGIAADRKGQLYEKP